MEGLAGWIIIGFGAWWFYNSGKRPGSQKGYYVGLNCSRKHRCR